MKRAVAALLSLLLPACVAVQKYDDLAAKYKKSQDDTVACGRDREAAAAQAAEAERKATEAAAAAAKEKEDAAKKQAADEEQRAAAARAVSSGIQPLIVAGKVKVAARDGLMTLQLPAAAYFAKGKAQLSKDGAAALAEVRSALADRRTIVTAPADMLSVSRALAVAGALGGTDAKPPIGVAGSDAGADIEVLVMPKTGS